jgi:dTDP-4-dehydrorhamnose 3,5-epimerase
VGTVGLDKIIVTPLKRIKTDGGDVLHGMKDGESGFVKFGEVYFSLIEFNQVKAWKRHMKMTLNLVVPIGQVRFVFISGDKDKSNAHRIIEIGERNYVRLTVPPGIWFGFKGIVSSQNLIMNIASHRHDQSEYEKTSEKSFTYDWDT